MNEALHLAPGLLASVEEGAAAAAEGGGAHHISYWGYFIVTALVVATIFLLLVLVRNGINNKVFRNKWTARGEQLYLFIENFALGVIGPHGRKYIPMLMTFWLFIFVSNFYGLFLPYAPTGDLSSNLGMAIVAVMYVQWEGMKANGIGGHFKHFAGPKLAGALMLVSGMIFIIEIISEAMKMISLSLRLYGNIHGGHEVVMNLNNLGHFHALGMEWAIPVGAVLLPVKLLTVIVQALVFTLLLAVYLSLVTHHEEDHGGAGHDADQGGHMLEPAHA